MNSDERPESVEPTRADAVAVRTLLSASRRSPSKPGTRPRQLETEEGQAAQARDTGR